MKTDKISILAEGITALKLSVAEQGGLCDNNEIFKFLRRYHKIICDNKLENPIQGYVRIVSFRFCSLTITCLLYNGDCIHIKYDF